MAKPRTNWDACAYWADSIHEREPRAGIEVNSIIVAHDVVYSFGRHYPMGVILRGPTGRARTIILNADSYPHRGFADTPGDQSNVASLAHSAVADASWEIEVRRIYLSGYSLDSQRGITLRPRDDDPEPEWARLEVPTYFWATDPGPEPVDDGEGCLAGTHETFEAQEDSLLWGDHHIVAQDQAYALSEKVRPGAHLVFSGSGRYTQQRRAFITRTVYGTHQHDWQAKNDGNIKLSSDDTYRECPHCKRFRELHERWYVRYHGPRWGRDRDRGWKLHSRMIERYGDEQSWREARRTDWRRVRANHLAHQEWVERNHIPLSELPTERLVGVSVPKLDRDGYPFRKDADAYFIRKRKRERAAKRQAAETAKRDRRLARERRAFERFRCDITRRRRRGFVEVAMETTEDLIRIRESIDARNNIRLESGDA